MFRVVLFCVRSAVVAGAWMTVGEDGTDWRQWRALAALGIQAALTACFIAVSLRGRRADQRDKAALVHVVAASRETAGDLEYRLLPCDPELGPAGRSGG